MIHKPEFTIEPLAPHHKRKHFSCGIHSLDEYFHRYIKQDVKKKISAAYVFLDRDHKAVIGYYTLSATGIPIHDLPNDLNKGLPKYPVIPAVLLGKLAVDVNHRGKGIGEILLLDALYKSMQYSDVIGALAVVVDAMDENASSFSQQYGFTPFTDQQRRLFITIKKIKDLF